MMRNLFKELQKPGGIRDDILDVRPIPAEAMNWLGRLTLLHGVPFQYLVPDEKMLPEESLRFFYVDPLWMEALLGGALSIGRTEEIPVLVNKVMAGEYTKGLILEARKNRPRQQEPATPPEGEFKFSGFLLRSELVSGWRGLSVTARAKPSGEADSQPLVTLRLERLARDVLFGLFEGHLGSLEIVQPLEGLHFEVTQKDGLLPNRVIDVKAAAQGLDNSARFAVKLLAQPARYTFSIKG